MVELGQHNAEGGRRDGSNRGLGERVGRRGEADAGRSELLSEIVGDGHFVGDCRLIGALRAIYDSENKGTDRLRISEVGRQIIVPIGETTGIRRSVEKISVNRLDKGRNLGLAGGRWAC